MHTHVVGAGQVHTKDKGNTEGSRRQHSKERVLHVTGVRVLNINSLGVHHISHSYSSLNNPMHLTSPTSPHQCSLHLPMHSPSTNASWVTHSLPLSHSSFLSSNAPQITHLSSSPHFLHPPHPMLLLPQPSYAHNTKYKFNATPIRLIPC